MSEEKQEAEVVEQQNETEQAHQVAEQQRQDKQAEVEAAFSGGFASMRGEPPAKPAEKAKPQAESERAEAAEQDDDPFAGLTREQIRTAIANAQRVTELEQEIARTRDGLYGKIGEVVRNQKGKSITKESLKRVAQAYGEDLAAALAEDLSGAALGSSVNIEELLAEKLKERDEQWEQRFENARTEFAREQEKKSLLREHGDFFQQIATPDFQLWIGQQDEATRKEFQETWDSGWLAGKMSDFKKWKAAIASKHAKKAELEKAVQPRGTQRVSGAMTAEQAFAAGFKSVAGR
jgi:hypothetical protein